MTIRPVVSGSLPRRKIRAPGHGIEGEFIGFCRSLRRAGLKITSGHIIDVFRCFDYLDVTHLDNVYAATRANLISSYEEIPLFDAVFRRYWFDETGNPYSGDNSDAMGDIFEEDTPEGAGEEGAGGEKGDDAEGQDQKDGKDTSGLPVDHDSQATAEAGDADEDDEGIPSYSPAEVLGSKDFSSFDADLIAELRRLISQIVP